MTEDMDRLHELDPGNAWSYGIGSGWRRLLLFFGSCAFSAAVALFCCQLPDTLQAFLNGDMLDVLGSGVENLLWSPLTWLGYIFEGISRNAGAILILPLLGAALLLILFGERSYCHGVFLILLAQPIQTHFAMDSSDELLSWGALGIYQLIVVGLYVRYLRMCGE